MPPFNLTSLYEAVIAIEIECGRQPDVLAISPEILSEMKEQCVYPAELFNDFDGYYNGIPFVVIRHREDIRGLLRRMEHPRLNCRGALPHTIVFNASSY